MVKNMKSVMVFDPDQTEEETANLFIGWLKRNKYSAVADRNIPNADETRRLLEKYG